MVALSGGVDSSVAAALLKAQGFDVTGLTMDIFSPPGQDRDRSPSLTGDGAIADASRVAAQLGIPHYSLNLKESFQEWVVDNFCEEYATGRTPNPCIRCNQHIKFGVLWKRAKKMGADYLATGHHARISLDGDSGTYRLKKGRDPQKDQSYFLYTLTQDQLAHTLMPIGDYTKQEIRKKAQELGLAVHQRPESQEICFIPDAGYVRFLEQKIPGVFEPGPIVDIEGRVLGHHRGILHFTIGQRRGLGIASPHPLYVLAIHPGSRKIVVGAAKHLYKKRMIVAQMNFLLREAVEDPVSVTAKIRYKHKEARASLHPLGHNKARVLFDTPQRAVTPGQSAVFYDQDLVWGGGIIQKTED
jgi:tRNA-specific 2-thiouridylase